VASWYGKDFDGKPTASGETFDMHAMTAAHRTLPLGTMLRVTNLDNGRSAVVKVNDRGPFIRGRDLDCSYGAAKELGYVNQGLARVRMEVVSAGRERPRYAPAAGEVLVGGPGTPGAMLDGTFTVQVGAFVNPDNAVRLRDRLIKSFGDAYVIRFREFYRVRVGHAATEEDAEALRLRLAAVGLDGFVTVND
jgi:rare lipoprotein A